MTDERERSDACFKHPFEWVTDPNIGERVRIDREIVPLIKAIWKLGLCTLNSCQNNFDYVWVQFVNSIHTETFLRTILRNGDPALAYRAKNLYSLSPEDRRRLKTQYHAWPDSWPIVAGTQDLDDDVWVTVAIRFPREHLERVMTALLNSPEKP
jgi:hypothetical protein